jgi:hypothetical protein
MIRQASGNKHPSLYEALLDTRDTLDLNIRMGETSEIFKRHGMSCDEALMLSKPELQKVLWNLPDKNELLFYFSLPPDAAMNRILRYETSIHRQMAYAINQLERLQRARKGEHVPAPVNVQVSGDQ